MLSALGLVMVWVGLRLTAATVPVIGDGSSAVAEGGLLLGDKGRHPLLLVLGGESRMKQAALEAHAFGERRLEGAVDRFLDHHRDRRRQRGDALGHGDSLRQQLVGRY